MNQKVAGGQSTCLDYRFGLQLGHVRETTNRYFSHIDVSLSVSGTKKNKPIKRLIDAAKCDNGMVIIFKSFKSLKIHSQLCTSEMVECLTKIMGKQNVIVEAGLWVGTWKFITLFTQLLYKIKLFYNKKF